VIVVVLEYPGFQVWSEKLEEQVPLDWKDFKDLRESLALQAIQE